MVRYQIAVVVGWCVIRLQWWLDGVLSDCSGGWMACYQIAVVVGWRVIRLQWWLDSALKLFNESQTRAQNVVASQTILFRFGLVNFFTQTQL